MLLGGRSISTDIVARRHLSDITYCFRGSIKERCIIQEGNGTSSLGQLT